MEPLNSDDKNVYVTLPSGIKLVRKIYSRYSDKELKSIIAECNTISQMVTILKLHRCYHNNIKKFINCLLNFSLSIFNIFFTTFFT